MMWTCLSREIVILDQILEYARIFGLMQFNPIVGNEEPHLQALTTSP
jgi:hypothetical protein